MDESRARIAARRPAQPVISPPEPPDTVTTAPAREPEKNCATCALYPCGLWKEGPAATILRTGAPFTFYTLSQMPMLCGGKYWVQRVQSAWERARRQAGPTGLSQFTKRNDEEGQ